MTPAAATILAKKTGAWLLARSQNHNTLRGIDQPPNSLPGSAMFYLSQSSELTLTPSPLCSGRSSAWLTPSR